MKIRNEQGNEITSYDTSKGYLVECKEKVVLAPQEEISHIELVNGKKVRIIDQAYCSGGEVERPFLLYKLYSPRELKRRNK